VRIFYAISTDFIDYLSEIIYSIDGLRWFIPAIAHGGLHPEAAH